MKHALEYIAKKLRDCRPVVTIDHPRTPFIRGLSLSGEPDPVWRENTLYLLDAETVREGRDLPPNFIYCSEEPLPVAKDRNRICFTQPAEPGRIEAAV